MTKHYLIIGNGAAGVSAAEIIRQRDKTGQITILTNEPYPMYSRPGIAYFILGQVSEQQIMARTEAFYRQHRFDLQVGQVMRLDLLGKTAHLADGQTLAYDVVLLATGATAVTPPFPGSDLDGVVTFDTLDNAKEVIKRARKARTAVIAGGGITALELAEGVRHQGAKTHLLQRHGRIWSRLFDERESAIIEQQIRQEKIDIHYHEEIAEIIGKRGKVAAVRLASDKTIKCQLVGVAIGVRPNIELVKGTAVQVNQGVLVNPYLQSSVPTLFAAGDVAQIYDRWTQAHHLDILWPSAINEGRTAGYNMVDVAYGRMPSHTYQKGTPFNAALLLGIHVTIIGRMGASRELSQQEAQYVSRGASQVWMTPFATNVHSAWAGHDFNSVRVVVENGRFVGALIIGNQELADPLRQLIENETMLNGHEQTIIHNPTKLPHLIRQLSDGS